MYMYIYICKNICKCRVELSHSYINDFNIFQPDMKRGCRVFFATAKKECLPAHEQRKHHSS